MRQRSCTVCGKPVQEREKNEAFPFCSPRCRQIDLGNWLGERYRVPGEPFDPTASKDPDGGS